MTDTRSIVTLMTLDIYIIPLLALIRALAYQLDRFTFTLSYTLGITIGMVSGSVSGEIGWFVHFTSLS